MASVDSSEGAEAGGMRLALAGAMRAAAPIAFPPAAAATAAGALPAAGLDGGAGDRPQARRARAGAGGERTRPPDLPLGGRSKRSADIAIAACALLLAAPVMLLIALLIRASDRGPAVFAHQRIGFRGRAFRCYKFRTMSGDADRILAAHLAREPEAAREWRERRKLRHDPRVTLLGALLRLSSLDELPQLFNILRGEMSCVGPRPVVADELPLYGAAVDAYLQSRPGLTGLWQVTGRSSTDYPTRVALDAQYVRTWSHRADALILLRTVFAVLRFRQVS